MIKTLKVDAIKRGTVIDHIPGGMGLEVLAILKPRPGEVVALGMNLSSHVLAKKDIVKIEGRELTQREVSKIALMAPNANVNIVRDYDVIKKYTVSLPKVFSGVFKCPNPQCITNAEVIKTVFTVFDGSPIRLQCTYCERDYLSNELYS
jgi:aspartate carbamoyltransferase regulatory subunit